MRNDVDRPDDAAQIRTRCWTLCAVGVGLLAAALSTFPLVTRLQDSIPDCPSTPRCHDNVLLMWIVAEGGRRLYSDPLHVFEANILHPLRHTLAYSESMLSAGALVAPLNALTGNPILGYNLYYLGTYVLSVLGVFLLVREITGDPRAALLAGWFFGLADERWWFRGHLAAISVHWVPFVFYGWIRFIKAPTIGRGIGLAAVLFAHAHASAYHGIMLPVLLVPWTLTLFLLGSWSWRRWLLSGAVVVCTLVAGFALYLPYVAVHGEVPYQPMILPTPWGIDRYWSGLADFAASLTAPLAGARARSSASPLPLLTLTLAAGLAAVLRPQGVRRPDERAHLTAAVLYWLAAAALSADPLLPGIPGPFTFLRELPGFGSMRSPGRFVILAAFGGATVMGIAVAAVLRRTRSRVAAAVLVLGLAGLVVVDTRPFRAPMPLRKLPTAEEVPAVYRWLATTEPNTAVLELPNDVEDDLLYMTYSLYHGRRLANGYSAMMPHLFRPDASFPTARDMRALQEAGIAYVIVHPNRFLKRPFGLGIVSNIVHKRRLKSRQSGRAWVLEIPPGRSSPARVHARNLDRLSWTLRGSGPGAAAAADGDLATHWTPPAGEQDSFLRVDLGAVQTVTGVKLRLGAHGLEFPRAYTVWGSSDGENWESLGGERKTAPPFASYRRNHRDVEMPLLVRPVRTRHLEIRVPARPAPYRMAFSRPLPNWGVHELEVYGEYTHAP